MGEYERGYQDAVRDCRDAVAALDLHRDSGTVLGCVYVPDALAAIDKLRGETND